MTTPAALRELADRLMADAGSDTRNEDHTDSLLRQAAVEIRCLLESRDLWMQLCHGYELANEYRENREKREAQLRTAASEGGAAVAWQGRFFDEVRNEWCEWRPMTESEAATYADISGWQTRQLFTRPPEVARDAESYSIGTHYGELPCSLAVSVAYGDLVETAIVNEEDANRYRSLRDSTNCSLTISHNDHHNMYLSVADTLNDSQGYYDDVPEDERAKMIETDTIWTVHVYPHTPVGFNVYHAATLDAAIDAALRARADDAAISGAAGEKV